MHYFPSNKYYLLVEDSTGEHRPIVIQEYNKPRKGEDASWPILHGGIEGRSAFYKYEGPPIMYQPRAKPDTLPKRPSLAPSAKTVDGSQSTKLMAGFSTTAARAVGAPNLRRAISLQNVPHAGVATVDDVAPGDSKHAAPGGIRRRDSYIAASGNSQIITSNTGTSTRSGAAMQPGTGKGSVIDKRLAVLANRTVSVSMGGSAASTKKDATVDKALKRAMSVDSQLRHASKNAVRPREEPKKPGYCENCRIKYDDFKTVRSVSSVAVVLTPELTRYASISTSSRTNIDASHSRNQTGPSSTSCSNRSSVNPTTVRFRSSTSQTLTPTRARPRPTRAVSKTLASSKTTTTAKKPTSGSSSRATRPSRSRGAKERTNYSRRKARAAE